MKEKTEKTARQWVTRVLLAMMACLLLNTAEGYAQQLTQQQKQAIQRRVKNKIEEFQFYLEQLGDRRFTDRGMRDEAYNLALKLFVGHGDQYNIYEPEQGAYVVKPPVKIQTSSKRNSRIVGRTIKSYLANLKNDARYTHISIQQADAVYVDEIYQKGDGIYECMAYFCQKYVAYREGRVVYSDITTKKVRVRIEKFEIPQPDGTTRVVWNVLLGDIYVVETH